MRAYFTFAEGLEELDESLDRYPNRINTFLEADVIVAFGGDGHILETIRTPVFQGIPIYGINLGHVGFLANQLDDYSNLEDRINNSREISLCPLDVTVCNDQGYWIHQKAYNELSIIRNSPQAAKMKISINGKTRLEELIGDGLLVATPAGSTAYNLSAHGPIIPLGQKLLAITPLVPFRPRRWRGALLPADSIIDIEILESEKRPVTAATDSIAFNGNIRQLTIHQNSDMCNVRLLFDRDNSLEERIIKEQFG